MAVSQVISPSLCSAWIFDRLGESSVLQSLCGGDGGLRAYQDVAVPVPTEGLRYPYLYWSGGTINQTAFYDRNRETWGVIHSRYIVRTVNRFNGRVGWEFFDPFLQELRAHLTGITAADVFDGSRKLGSVWNSRFISDFSHEDKDGEARLIERGILIEISHL